MSILNRFYLILVVVLAVGCSKNSFSSNESSKSSDSGTPVTGQSDPPGSSSSTTISPPVTFSASNCSIPYPYKSTSPASSVDFAESLVLMAFSPQTIVSISPGLSVNLWYGDEHPMTLGVRQVTVIDAHGNSSVTNYPVSQMSQSPSIVNAPEVGSMALSGDQAGVDSSVCTSAAEDSCSRPLYPALFVTDITTQANNIGGDWQFGGMPIAPSAIYGTWKAATRTVDHTYSPPKVTVEPDSDDGIKANVWNLGQGIPAPSNLTILSGGTDGAPTSPAPANESFSTLVSWNVAALGLQSGHTYRMQFMVHDGDQKSSGGDVGQNCVNLTIP